MRTIGNFIGGTHREPASTLHDLAPATGAPIARIPRSGAAEVAEAVQAAKSALPAWSATPVAERARLLDRLADAIEARKDELARLESEDAGKTYKQARDVDIPRAIANFRFFAGAARHDEPPSHPMPGALNYTVKKPVGVCALITPWNLPLYLLTWKTAPALAMGNTVVAKPSELTPLTAHALGEIASSVGLPPGVLNIVHGLGAECGEPLVAHPDVAAVSFTGGTATGGRVSAAAAAGFKKLSLELGGKNATVVFADCDFEQAVAGTVRAGFSNNGEICLCGSRVLVERGVYPRFVEALVERVRALRVGDPSDERTDVGALISEQHRAKVEGYLELARNEGGRILCGGTRPKLAAPFDRGAFLDPAVIAELAPTCRTATEEIFGPVVTVHPFDTDAEALAIANGVRYGLSASVWTRDLSRAHRFSAQLDVGMVWVNTWLLRDLRVPFGGVKESGVGREGGRWSLEFFSQAQNVCVAL
jgi:aminomuconate-semialdehyde/2-hydroxymuconate-6-semialdehyde dehydrogenase